MTVILAPALGGRHSGGLRPFGTRAALAPSACAGAGLLSTPLLRESEGADRARLESRGRSFSNRSTGRAGGWQGGCREPEGVRHPDRHPTEAAGYWGAI